MKQVDVEKVKNEIKRLVAAIKDMEKAQPLVIKSDRFYCSKETSAVKRASMDLTRALTDMRHPWRR
jgi:hypothetical protein